MKELNKGNDSDRKRKVPYSIGEKTKKRLKKEGKNGNQERGRG